MNIVNNLVLSALCCIALFFSGVSYSSVKDVTLEGKAKMVMILKKGVPSSSIKTNAYDGKLQIVGYVDNAEELRQVNDCIAEYLRDDKHEIINNVKIYHAKSSLNDELKLENKLKNKFKVENIAVSDLTIQAKASHIMLSGFVDQNVDIAKIINVAKSLQGVAHVDNSLLRK